MMNVFKSNEQERSRHEAEANDSLVNTLKRRSEAAAQLVSQLTDFLPERFHGVSVSQTDDVVTLTRPDGMTLTITVLDKLYNLDYPGATDVMAKHRKNFGSYVMEKQMTAKVVDWLNGKI
jgi:hypothetical protein